VGHRIELEPDIMHETVYRQLVEDLLHLEQLARVEARGNEGEEREGVLGLLLARF